MPVFKKRFGLINGLRAISMHQCFKLCDFKFRNELIIDAIVYDLIFVFLDPRGPISNLISDASDLNRPGI
jgi:hypothetical protein